MRGVIRTLWLTGRKAEVVFALSALLLALPLAVSAVLSYQPKGFVNDFAGVMTLSERDALEDQIAQFEKQTGNEISVAIIPSLGGDTVENVAVELFKQWGIGKEGVDNGILLLVAQEDRALRIEVGYGLEGVVTDIFANQVINQIVIPEFKAGNFGAGISNGVDALIAKISGETPVIPSTSKSSLLWSLLSRAIDAFGPFVFFFVFIVLEWFISILARSKSWWAGGVIGFGVSILFGLIMASWLIFIIEAILFVSAGLLIDYKVSKAYQEEKKTGKKSSWLWGGGFGRGSGRSFGGGFGGFGGGMSGGGGASGRW